MSDLDDELLDLVGDGNHNHPEKKRKKRQVSSSKPAAKKRKQDISSESEAGPESEEEEELTTPYPLEGKYTDELDRERLLSMSEIDRENILGERQEELQKLQDKRSLDQMLKAQSKGMDGDSVSKAAKRQHAVRGATKEKARGLEDLKARRKAKEKRSKNSPRRDRSSSPMDTGTDDDDDDEDGQITKYEEEEERDRKRFGKSEPDDEPITVEDLNKCRISRGLLAKHCMAPWFDEYIKGAWVRYLVGTDRGEPVYRICEIRELGIDAVKPYKIDDKIIDRNFELKHGKSVKWFSMDKASNSEFLVKEFERLQNTCRSDGAKLPTKRQLEKKIEELKKFADRPMTESDVKAMLARKNLMQQGKHSGQSATIERSRLIQARTLASRRQDYEELAEIDKKLADLPAVAAAREEEISDKLAKVNERNRKANLEAVRKAEIHEAERKRRERKLAQQRASGTATPTHHDPSARLKTVPKLFNNVSRPGTPKSNGGTPLLQADQAGGPTRSVSPLPPSALSGRASSPAKSKTFEASVIDSIEVDLGDF